MEMSLFQPTEEHLNPQSLAEQNKISHLALLKALETAVQVSKRGEKTHRQL